MKKSREQLLGPADYGRTELKTPADLVYFPGRPISMLQGAV